MFFDPYKHPEDTVKAFDKFTQVFELRYEAQFPDPPKVSMLLDAGHLHTTTEDPNPKLNLTQ